MFANYHMVGMADLQDEKSKRLFLQ